MITAHYERTQKACRRLYCRHELLFPDFIMQRISAVGAALYYSRAWYRPQYKHGQGGRGIKSFDDSPAAPAGSARPAVF